MLINSKGEVVQVQNRFRNHVEREAALAPIREVLAVRSSTGPMFGIEARARLTKESGQHFGAQWRYRYRADLTRKSARHWDRPIRQEAVKALRRHVAKSEAFTRNAKKFKEQMLNEFPGTRTGRISSDSEAYGNIPKQGLYHGLTR